jgi:type VI secretion system protein VasD
MSAVLALAGCAAKPPPPPKPIDTHTMIAASADVNPDPAGRASPVVVRIYQLRGDAEFNGADFFALFDKERETLGASLILREERTVFPGQELQLTLPLAPDVRFVAVAAAYRDIASTRWRAIVAATLKGSEKKRAIAINVDKDAIRLTSGG